MGSWSVSITGNDTAADLKSEYTAAFYYYPTEQALQAIDNYVRKTGFSEQDAPEWCDYYYSLADFMHSKGILTEEVKQTALAMIDSGFGLEIWEEAGEKTLLARQKALQKFREKLVSVQPAPKKIKPNVHTEDIFEVGDIVAVQLQTKGKNYSENDIKPLTAEEFAAADGKYIVMQKIKTHASWSSAIVPQVKDYWVIFRLLDGIYDTVPELKDIDIQKNAIVQAGSNISPLFYCESSLFYFKRRKYKVLGNDKTDIQLYQNIRYDGIYFGVERPWKNPDSLFLSSMGKEFVKRKHSGSLEELKEKYAALCYWHGIPYGLSSTEWESERDKQKDALFADLERIFAAGGTFYEFNIVQTVGMVAVLNRRIDHLYAKVIYNNSKLVNALLQYVLQQTDEDLCMDVPRERGALCRQCGEEGGVQTDGAPEGFERFCWKR